MTALITSTTQWYCPACKAEETTTEARAHSRFHSCPRLRGVSVPMTRAGVKAKVELHEREDYTGPNPLLPVRGQPKKRVNAIPLVDGRPVMSVVTTRDDGQDVMVFAPTALARIR